MIDQKFFRPRVVAKVFGCTYDTIAKYIRAGRIPAVNLGSIASPRWWIPLSWLESAMRGEARWKYPESIRPVCRTEKTAEKLLVQALDEEKKLDEIEEEYDG
jgi:hypothetical protein